jgi:hypothetical protein
MLTYAATSISVGSRPNDRHTNRWSAAIGTTTYSYDSVGNLTAIPYPHSTLERRDDYASAYFEATKIPLK